MPIPLLNLTADPLDVQAVSGARSRRPATGATARWRVFVGNVRGENLGRRVVELEYEAYEPLALNVVRHHRGRGGRGVAGRRRSRSGTGSDAWPSAMPAS